ncbi:hypothetical protein BI308_22230 [Roseofilum reptotaenium AO1-A]|uniref:Knr4/Smi1-like domain-containing protein n=1 Tax=Roseofilum reptotaenium AO1-A TaxID=1925591 RepID=A0A1L9QL40_9CYAN|nr:SMI1/KNR4 family protein [Roseofilum reptotaenium]OJJ18414.1 hypothetical protein BI308_22230 [Roseofilum reptotaenium AO1-A]
MSKLTQALDRISNRLATYSPHRFNDLCPRLDISEIENFMQPLSFRLPADIDVLYQWHDGDNHEGFLFADYNFLSLELAVYKYYEVIDEDLDILGEMYEEDTPGITELFKNCLPLFEFCNKDDVLIAVDCRDLDASPIYSYDLSNRNFAKRYHSFTDLILHLADWYECAQFSEDKNCWELRDSVVEHQLNVNHMARDYITRLVRQGQSIPIYEQFLAENQLEDPKTISEVGLPFAPEETRLQRQIRNSLQLATHTAPIPNRPEIIYTFRGTCADGELVTVELRWQHYQDSRNLQSYQIGYFLYNNTILYLLSVSAFNQNQIAGRFFRHEGQLKTLTEKCRQHNGCLKLTRDASDRHWVLRMYGVSTCGTHWSVDKIHTLIWRFDLTTLTVSYSEFTEIDASQ